MQRFSVFMLLWLVAIGSNVAAGQDDEKPIQKLFKPIKEFRTRHCNPNPVKGCACAKCKAKRQKKLCERCIEKAKEAAEKEKEKQQLIMDLEKLALEMKKLAEEKKDFEKKMEEKYKEWDVADATDPKSPEYKNELLKMAAAVKADQDLEPKKIQALQYIAGLGCAKVPDAPKIVLAGLKDPNVNVRAAAVQAILSPYLQPYGYGDFYAGMEYGGMPPIVSPEEAMQFNVTGCAGGTCSTCPPNRRSTRRESKACDFCKHQTSIDAVIAQLNPDCPKKTCQCPNPCDQSQGRRFKTHKKRGRCGFCRGRGCQNCQHSGQIEEIVEVPCDVQPQQPSLPDLTQCQCTDACQSCCTEDIQKELKKIAFGTKDDGCFYEPNETVRNMAAQALQLCPGIPEKTPDVPEQADVTEESDVTEGEDTPSEDLGDEELDLNSQDGDDSTTYFRGTRRRIGRSVSSARNYADQSAGPITHTAGIVKSVNADGTVDIQLSGEFLIPERFVIEIETSNGQQYEGTVIQSNVGSVRIRSNGLPIRVGQGERLRFGVIATRPEDV